MHLRMLAAAVRYRSFRARRLLARAAACEYRLAARLLVHLVLWPWVLVPPLAVTLLAAVCACVLATAAVLVAACLCAAVPAAVLVVCFVCLAARPRLVAV